MTVFDEALQGADLLRRLALNRATEDVLRRSRHWPRIVRRCDALNHLDRPGRLLWLLTTAFQRSASGHLSATYVRDGGWINRLGADRHFGRAHAGRVVLIEERGDLHRINICSRGACYRTSLTATIVMVHRASLS